MWQSTLISLAGARVADERASGDAVDQGLTIDDVSLSYGVTVALRRISLHVPPGQVVGLMGHNGAGKSSLLKVMSGAVRPSGGTVRVAGAAVSSYGDPRHFAELGVAVVHQEPALAPNLSILDNLMLCRDRRVGNQRRKDAAPRILTELGVVRDPSTPVSVLSLGERQMVDLARGMLEGQIAVLLLDEPAAALGALETAVLHERIRALSRNGTAVVYVSHRLPDVLDICDRIVALREGEIIMDEPRSTFSARTLATALAGESEEVATSSAQLGPKVCTVGSHYNDLEFRSGEVVGLFGVAGGPQFELLDALFRGSMDMTATLDGKPYTPSGPAQALADGVHLVPADREQDGLVRNMSAIENVFLPWGKAYSSKGRIQFREQRRLYGRIREHLNIQGPTSAAAIEAFSGGNRQKHLIARWALVRRPRLLLLAQPTQGVDESAKADILRVIRSLATEGVAIVVASAENDELSSMCDRVYALTATGQKEFAANDSLDEQLLEFIGGQHLQGTDR